VATPTVPQQRRQATGGRLIWAALVLISSKSNTGRVTIHLRTDLTFKLRFGTRFVTALLLHAFDLET